MTPEEIVFNLGDCLCQLLEDGENPVGSCCVVATAPVIPNCCQGFAWVRPTGSTVVPYDPRQRCLPPVWNLGVELGIARCVAGNCGVLENPCCENEAAAALVLMSDFTALQRALLCCLPAITGGPKLDQITIQGWIVEEPEGGCVTGRMLATIEYYNSCAC